MNSTSGPAVDENRIVNIGVGAHIAAAAEGGKRFEKNMTRAERSSGSNGIWLCQSCSKLIDSDDQRFATRLLHQWKKDAEQRALDALAGGRPLGGIRPPSALDAADEEFLRGLNLPSADALDTVSTRLRMATQVDLQAFRAMQGRPSRTIALTLRLEDSSTPNTTIENVARLSALAGPISVIAPGGTGKSTTLLQIAEAMAEGDGMIPLFVPLGEWSDRQEDFLDSILRRSAFRTFRREHLMQLAYHGRLSLMLDGWNELTPEARLRATNDLNALQRDYPQLGLVISTRRQALPVAGPVINIESLSDDQQMELANATRGQEGIDLVDRAWRTTGLRDLVSIPLYLNTLLTLPHGAAFPETKEAVLRMFVQHNEASPEKIERLNRDTLGQHEVVLTGLAVEANRSANTVISDSNANRTVTSIMRRLADDGQIGAPPQPRVVVDGLVNAHLLVRSSGVGGAVSFQHQLFQEWYAAADVERLMLRTAAGSPDARKELRENVLNWTSWEESILFACDRLSRAGPEGVAAVALAIELALGIDPLLAANMIYRSSDAVWQSARERVMRFIERWHTCGSIDRAARFMVTAGKPEFAELVWPLASSTDDQVQFGFFRAADRFRPDVLGPDAEGRLRSLPLKQRELALSEIASNSGFDGMELVTRLASSDPDASVVVGIVQALAFRRGDRHVNRIMQTASYAVWRALGDESHPDHISDEKLHTRLLAERQSARTAETRPTRLLSRLTDERPSDAEARIASLVAAGEIDKNSMFFEHAIAEAHSKYPSAVASGLLDRITRGLPLPYRAGDYLHEGPAVETGPIADAVLSPSTPDPILNAAAAAVGPAVVSSLFDQFIAVDEQIKVLGRYDEALSKAHFRLVGALTATRETSFVPTLIDKGKTSDPRRIGLLADVLARFDERGDKRSPIDAAHRPGLRALVLSWIESLLAAAEPARHDASKVAGAAGRLADPALAEPLQRLLARDLTDYEAARAARISSRGRSSGDITGYTFMYARAFAAMHDGPVVEVLTRGLSDLRWGVDAAGALHEIWLADHGAKERRFGGWTDYSDHLALREKRNAVVPLPTSDFAEAIFAVVRNLGNADKPEKEQQHAVALAVTGLRLPHGSKRREIDTLLALPLPISNKQSLLSAAARAGEILPSAHLMEGLQNLLEIAKKDAWRLDENRGELMGWIDLFPFSDNTALIHDAIALLPAQHKRPHNLRRLLETIPQGPVDQTLPILVRLAADEPSFMTEFEWLNALLKIDTEAAAHTAINYLNDGRLTVGDGFRLSSALAEWARKYPTVKTAIIDRYRSASENKVRGVLEMAMDDLSDEEVFLALFEGHLGRPHAQHGLGHAIRKLAVGSKPSDTFAGAFEEFGLPLTELRARLFAMTSDNDERAQLAKQCLIEIEERRDDRGRVSNEPRHPDISSGRSWPPEADETVPSPSVNQPVHSAQATPPQGHDS